VGEAGVVGVHDPITGSAIAAFVIPSSRSHGPEADGEAYWLERSAALREALRSHVANEIGPIAKPRDVFVVPDLPKTRSGKIMRRLLGDIVDQRPLGDTTSLQDEAAPHRIAEIVTAARTPRARE
jgi:acetyl-CoA synthetase